MKQSKCCCFDIAVSFNQDACGWKRVLWRFRDFLKSLKVREQEREVEVFAAEEGLNKILREEWVVNSPDPIPELA